MNKLEWGCQSGESYFKKKKGLISFLKIYQVLREYQKLSYEGLGKQELKFKHEKSLPKAKVSNVNEKTGFLHSKAKELSEHY